MASTEVDEESPRSGPRLVHIAPIVPILIVATLAARAIRDNSFLWHIRAGEVQATSGHVLAQDPFSFTEGGTAWLTQSWLAELWYAWLEATFGGLAWANWMVLVVASLTIGFVGLAVYRSLSSPITTALVMVLAAWLMGPFIQPRPVIFSYLLAAMLVVVIQHKERLLWSAVPIIWIWAAVHGSWVIGGALILLEFLRTFDRRLFFAGLIAGVSTLATAHGLGTWQIVLDFFGSRETLSLMEEWNVPEFTDFVQAPYLLLIFGVIVAGIRSKITVRDLVVILPFLVFGMSSRRAVFPAAIVLLPWAALAIPPVPASRSGVSRGVVVAAGAVFGLVALSPMLLNPLGQLYEERFPSPEIVEALGDGRAFHGDGEGGYLIYATWPEREVYIDDRAELYGIDHFREYRDVRSGVYREAFERWGIEAVLAQAEWALTDVLTADGWTVVASDEYFTVFQRP